MWKTFRAEIRHIFTNKWRFAALILLLLIPFTYGFLYMNAYWAPFSHVDRLKIAVVNRDHIGSTDKNTHLSQKFIDAATHKGSITTGTNQIYDLIEDESISVNPEDAVDSGKYAAVIVIPNGYDTAMTQFATDIKSHDPVAPIKLEEIRKAFAKATASMKNAPGTGKHEFDRITFYFSYKHSYLSGEMTNFISSNTILVMNALFPNGLPLSSTLLPIIKNQLSDSIHKYGHKEFNTYGKGLAPYFISIALWAGALATLFVVKNDRHIKTEGTVKNFLGKLAVWLAISWTQATILISALVLQGIRVGGGLDDIWRLFLFAYFMATIFPMIVMSVAYTMRYGDIGEFIVVILLVMQLISSSGTFPVEMQNIIFKIIHPVAPFTYTIHALREIMWDTDIGKLFFDMGILIVFPVVLIPLSLLINWLFDRRTVTTLKGVKQYQSFEIHLGDF